MFGSGFNQSLVDVHLGNNLQELVLGFAFDHSLIDVKLPSTLVKLRLGVYFNHPLEGVTLPQTLEVIEFQDWSRCAFNQPIERVVWPPNIRSLYFYNAFNQTVKDTCWPANLEILSFKECTSFNHSLVGCIFPPSLHTISLPNHYHASVIGVNWPAKLVKLQLGYYCTSELSTHWPSSLHTFTIPSTVRQGQNASGDLSTLPHALQQLEINFGFPGNCDHKPQVYEIMKRLFVTQNLAIERAAEIGAQQVANTSTLTRILFREFNLPIAGIVWPSSLRVLQLGAKFNQSVSSVDGVHFPSGLNELYLCTITNNHDGMNSRFNQPIDELQLPESLFVLQLGTSFTHSISKLKLPSCLLQLAIGGVCVDEANSLLIQSIMNIELPATLRWLIVPGVKANTDRIAHAASVSTVAASTSCATLYTDSSSSSSSIIYLLLLLLLLHLLVLLLLLPLTGAAASVTSCAATTTILSSSLLPLSSSSSSSSSSLKQPRHEPSFSSWLTQLQQQSPLLQIIIHKEK